MIGKNIYEIRKRKKLSLSSLAERAGISKSYLSNIERNVHQNPSIQVLNKIAKILEVDLVTLVGNDVNSRPKKEDIPDNEWMEIVNKMKETGIEKEQIEEYKTLIEFIKWKNEK
ncbi:helix-turn-helix domain-containing protein [Heyndrickxia acidicola]|uniref:Helix-turn-helix transcriptional regulator n=1 Tax=Heyndrickxia acidicola TaxID=209389 RepID=A0ABU6MLG1_9BACI|nr:helix-turn-helix transcriptional regulator [Heyndrickxia acidicola]MED1205203.1 helix-turn-helix transcriptional regulator [Heyndrickxia acidicola]